MILDTSEGAIRILTDQQVADEYNLESLVKRTRRGNGRVVEALTRAA